MPPTGRAVHRYRTRLALGAVLAALATVLVIALPVLDRAAPRRPTATVDPAASLVAPSADSGSAAPAEPTAPAPSTTPVQPATGATETSSAGEQTVPATIAADCSENVTKPLNAWMASVPDGSVLVFGPGACYRVDGTLLLEDRHDLTLDGNGASFVSTFVPPTSPEVTRPMWAVVGGSDLTITNMADQGTNTSGQYDIHREWLPLIQIAGATNVLVDGVRGSYSWGDFVSIGPDVRRATNSEGTGAVLAQDITIRDSTAGRIGRHGVSCTGCENVLIDRNVFSDIGYQVVDLEVEADTWYARDLAVTDNTIEGTVQHSVLANAGTGRYVTGITVSGNTMTGDPVTCAPPVQVESTRAAKSDYVITGNRFATLGNAFWLQGVSDATVEDNSVAFGSGGCTNPGVAVVVSSNSGDAVADNDFNGATSLFQAGASGIGTACGNRLAGTSYDQPQPCASS